MRLLRFLSHYLWFLKYVPGLPQAFDAALLLFTYFFYPHRMELFDKLTEQVMQWPGVHLTIHKFGGQGFAVATREFAHLHGNGVLDILLTKKAALSTIEQGLAHPHHTLPSGGLVSLQVDSAVDVANGLMLLHTAYELQK